MRTRLRSAAIACAVAIAAVPAAFLCAQNRAETVPMETPAPIQIPRLPQIQLLPVPSYGPAPLMAGFLVTSLTPGVTLQSFRWNFGDGQVSTLPPTALFHTYANPGSYVVTVTATTAGGRAVSAFGGVIVTTPVR
ncbi:MAG: PKD domain-containing protein [Candidatus Binataceae bacterium]